MNRTFLKDGFLWGFILWLIGYVLGIVLFMLAPANLIGWFITPIGIAITLWVLLKKVKSQSVGYFLKIGIIWALIAIIFDYIFIVKLFKSESYYKLDVYFYYASAFFLPLLVGWYKTSKKKKQ